MLTSPIFDRGRSDAKLLGDGVEITDKFLERLTARDKDQVWVSSRDFAFLRSYQPQGILRKSQFEHSYWRSSLQCAESERLDDQIATLNKCEYQLSSIQSVDAPSGAFDAEAQRELAREHDRQLSYLDAMFRSTLANGAPEYGELADISSRCVAAVMKDKDLYACLGVNPYGTEYPIRHSLHTAKLAILMGVHLGLGDRDLECLGIGCMVHDVGMVHIPGKPFEKKRQLSDRELAELSEHPVKTLQHIDSAGTSIPLLSRIVCY